MNEGDSGPKRRIDSVEEAFRVMAEDLGRGDLAQAMVIGDHLLRADPAHGATVRKLYEDALARGLEDSRLGQRLWEMDRAEGRHREYASAAGQDRYLDGTVFRGLTGGVFVDIGAYDGVTGSNTLFFEQQRSWTGLCVEASPVQFEILKARRGAESIHAAMADFEGEAAFLEITEGFSQMSGLTQSLRRGFRGALAALATETPTEAQEITVPVTTLTTAARARGMAAIDYCSIDVEGAELSVLKGIDFEALAIRAFSVENPADEAENHAAIRDFMAANGYALLTTIGADDIFAKED